MMAKMFYTIDEARSALGKSEEEIKQLAREGRLREFRDGPRLMFKADQVEQLKAEMSGDAGVVDLGPSDSGMAIGLADSKGPSGTGTGLTLADTDGGRSPGAGLTMKEDTALAADLGLSGSVGGVPSPGRPSGSGTGLSGSQQGRGGVDVFQSDEVERVDPMAQTSISSGVNEQMNLEGVGSGSGLLDLTRESDDTSLGAELLDEIAPSGTRGRGTPADSGAGIGSGSGIGSGIQETRGAVSRGAPALQVREAPDPMAPAFAGMAFVAAIVLMGVAFVLTTGVMGFNPAYVAQLAPVKFIIIAGAAIGLSVVGFFGGLIFGKIFG